MRATTMKSCDWPGCSFRTDIGASIHYPTIKSTTAEQRRRRSPVSTLIHRMIMTIMMMVWWCNGDGDEDDDQKYKTARGQQSCVSTLIQRPSLSQDYPGLALHQDLPEDLPFQQSAFVQDCSGFKEDLQSQKCTNICSGFSGHAWANHKMTACLTV